MRALSVDAFVKPAWSPDGKQIPAGCYPGGVDTLRVIDVPRGEVTLIVDLSSESKPVNFPP